MNKDFINFVKMMNNAYKSCNHHDSQYAIEDLKKKYSDKEIIAFLNKEILVRRNNERLKEAEIEKIEAKYSPRDYYLWEEALNYVKHRYQSGEHIFFYYDGIQSGKICKLTRKGYKVFIGRKLGIEPEIPFKDVICHVSNNKRILEELKLFEERQKVKQ